MAVRKRTEEKPKVERVYIRNVKTGTVCTVGSDVVGKYTEGNAASFKLYDDESDDAEETPEPTQKAPVKK